MRTHAILAMGKTGDQSLIPYAIPLLQHPDKSIRRYALGGLKNISGREFNTIEEWKIWIKNQK